MKKINNKVYRKLMGLRENKSTARKNSIAVACLSLKIGEILFLNSKEWKLRTPIHTYIRNISLRKSRKMEVRRINDRGWTIKRLR